MMEDIKKQHPNFFIIIIALIMSLLYFILIKLLLLDLHTLQTFPTVVFLIFYHIFLLLLVWSIFESIRKDPGRVPMQWGFSQDNRNKKYCIICHVFKPERTHHCSACNRCVLNMDHHCPWINSCIGFYNRKAFILMLTYTVIITFMNIILFFLSASKVIEIFKNSPDFFMVFRLIVVIAAFIFDVVIFVTIFLFQKFHIELILNNMTTLQTLELKRQGKDPDNEQSQYNIGKYYNWIQVFGRNWAVWWVPIFLENSGPSGDGVLWPKKSSHAEQP